MKFKTYGSGSSGNTHVLTSSTGHSLILDAGIRPHLIFRDIKPSSIDGVLITHEHKDHSAYAEKYAENMINVYAPFSSDRLKIITDGMVFKVGEFKVMVLQMNHDVNCVGFLIHHEELDGDILYATDTNGIPWEFNNLAIAAIEADYHIKIMRENIENGSLNISVAQRTQQTHNSLIQAMNFVNKNVKRVQNIVLVHLSKDNARKDLFLKIAKDYTDKNVFVAEEGFELEVHKHDIFN